MIISTWPDFSRKTVDHSLLEHMTSVIFLFSDQSFSSMSSLLTNELLQVGAPMGACKDTGAPNRTPWSSSVNGNVYSGTIEFRTRPTAGASNTSTWSTSAVLLSLLLTVKLFLSSNSFFLYFSTVFYRRNWYQVLMWACFTVQMTINALIVLWSGDGRWWKVGSMLI